MIYFPGTINIVSTRLYCHTIYINNGFTFIFQLCTSTYSMHAGILKLCRGRLPRPLVVFSFHFVSRLPSSFVQSQLTLPVPTTGIRLPPPQDGVPIRRVRTHSLITYLTNFDARENPLARQYPLILSIDQGALNSESFGHSCIHHI